jgi:hypothetical protein
MRSLKNLPDAFKSLNSIRWNLTKSSVTLVHKAEVESITPKLTTKLSLQSVVREVLHVTLEHTTSCPVHETSIGL